MTIRDLAFACASGIALCLGAPALAQTAVPAIPSVSDLDAMKNWGFGVQTRYIDSTIRPGDDFFRHVNGKWYDLAEIPPDRTSTGGAILLRDLSEERMRSILEETAAGTHPEGSAKARVAAVWKAFMDEGAIERAGLAPLYPVLERIYAARTPDDLAALFATPGMASPVVLGVGPDSKNSSVNALFASQGGLGMPDRDYYLVDNARNREIVARYKQYLTFVFTELGYADPAAASEAVYSLETGMARATWDRALGRNRDLTYNKMSLAEFEALAPGIPLHTMLEKIGAGSASEIIVRQLPPSAEEIATAKLTVEQAGKLSGGVPALARLIGSEPVATWQAWLAVRFVTTKAAVLPKRIDDAQFAFYGTVLSGQPQQRPRWKRAIAAVEGAVGELAGQVYAERYFPAANKAVMEQLVGNLRLAMAANLKDLKWMGQATRTEAQAKLDAFRPKIGYPDSYKTYDGLQVAENSAMANAQAADAWQLADTMRRLGKPVDRNEWLMFPQTVNAYYLPTGNEIVFPAAILQPPYFNLSADDAVNYGAIGGVIGHEMGHGFDDQGSKSDGEGNLRDWWTPQDKANFQKLTSALVDQYDAHCPLDDGKTCVNGRLTLGENIGDLGGLSLAYRAYKLSLGGRQAPVIDGYTGDQRFFMAWAQAFRIKIREAALRQQMQTDPHSPGLYRVNGIVRNFDEWYKAFNIQPGDKLYLPPEKRIRIW